MIDVRRAVVKVRLLTGTYYLLTDRAKFHGSGTTNLCLLCSAAPEDRPLDATKRINIRAQFNRRWT